MEKSDPSNRTKRSLWRSSNSHISMSDAESIISQAESWHSPLRSESPLRSDDPRFQLKQDHLGNRSGKPLVTVDKYYSPSPSPGISKFPASSPPAAVRNWQPWTHSEKLGSGNSDFPESPMVKGGRGEKPSVDFAAKGNSPVVLGLNKLVRDEPPSSVAKVGSIGRGGGGGGGGLDEGGEDEVEGGERRLRARISRMSERTTAVGKAALLFRVFEAIVCLISFSVMAADKTQGWSGDSYDRYKEYKYCVAVNVIGFVYSGFQAYSLAYHLGTGKHVIPHDLHYPFDFSMDQILSYLTLSASSSAATRVTDWVFNWGKDEFTSMASASIAMSFLGFIAFAFSALISGYNFCNRD